MRYAFFTNNDAGSVPSLERNCDRIDALIPDWLQLAKPNGRVELSVDSRSTEVVRWLRGSGSHLAVYPQLSSELSAREILGALAGAGTRSALIEQIGDYLRSNDFQGAVVDLPELPPSSFGTVAVFLDQLRTRLHAEGRKLLVVSEPGDEERRVQELSQLVDYVVILAHDQSSVRTERGPIAPQGWFEARIERQLALIPPDKLIISVGSFGYDIDAYSGTRLISAQQAWDIAQSTGAELRLDGRTLNTNFAYKLPDGRVHQVWLLDAVTAFNQVKVALAARPAGIAIWRLGLEDPGVFEFAGRGRVPDAAALTAIRRVEPGFGSFLDTHGALISASPGAPGAREISFNQSLGLIVDQAMKIYPRQVHLSVLRAKDPKAIALTFDDGPDTVFTPKILDILAQKGIRGTFYIVGRNALMSLDLLRRIQAEGHDIGNHTFSHPNLFHSAPQRIAAELNATQRIFEAELGVGTRLFRPPYSMETYGYLEASPLLVETASRMGYMIGGIEVDPQDYLNKPDRTAEDVVKQVSQGAGQVVLLHDAGGNREATVEALPRIIDALQAAGFHFVTTHDLVGLSRDQVMPPLPPDHPTEQVKAGLWLGSVRTVAWFGAAIPLIAIVTAILGIVRLLLIVAGALVHASRRRSSAAEPLKRFKGTIAVVVPAY
ncbi:MAG: polysaccharide deacetylase family protein, partial [Methyloceanibacter sp.]